MDDFPPSVQVAEKKTKKKKELSEEEEGEGEEHTAEKHL